MRPASEGSVPRSPVMRKARYSAMPSHPVARDQAPGTFSLVHSSLQAEKSGCYVPGQSDIDLFVVCQHPSEVEKKQTVADVIAGEAANCPTRGMEFVLYFQGAVAKPSQTPHFEINLNAGPQMPYHLSFDSASEPSHWFVLDISIVREDGLPLVGPAAREVFAPITRPWVLEAL